MNAEEGNWIKERNQCWDAGEKDQLEQSRLMDMCEIPC